MGEESPHTPLLVPLAGGALCQEGRLGMRRRATQGGKADKRKFPSVRHAS